MSDISAAVLEKILDLLDRVKEVEKENERLHRRVGNLETLQETPVLVPDTDPDELPPLIDHQKETALRFGVSDKNYQKLIKESKQDLHDKRQAATQALQSQAHAAASQFGGLSGASPGAAFGGLERTLTDADFDSFKTQFEQGRSLFDRLRGKKKK